MYLENIVFDAIDPRRTGLFWQELLGTRELTDSPEGFETRYALPGGPTLDLCLQPVPDPPAAADRVRLILHGLPESGSLVAAALRLGARHLQGVVPPGPPPGREAADEYRMLTDPEGNTFTVLESAGISSATGILGTVSVESADPARDADFWAWLSGWDRVPAPEGAALPERAHPGLHAGARVPVELELLHPSGRGPLLRFVPERSAKTNSKNPVHLDIRLEAADDPDVVAAGIIARGGRELQPGWGTLPWRVYQDPSGNEFCVLPASQS